MQLPIHRIRVLDRAHCRALDCAAQQEYGIPAIALMENAAVGAVEIAVGMMQPGASVAVVCGPGANGGDGWAMARHLHNGGFDVLVVALSPIPGGTTAAVNAMITRKMGIEISNAIEPVAHTDLIVDAIFGTGLDRDLDGPLRAGVEAINAAPGQVLAVDVPSGLDADTGSPRGAAVRADRTATLACWKAGFQELESLLWTGEIHAVDIGVPQELADRLGSPLEPAAKHGRGG